MPVKEDGTVEKPATGGPGSHSPLEVPAAGWQAVGRRTVRGIVHDRITITAAGVALFWFLSIFPLLFAAIGLLDVINAAPSTSRAINEAITRALPGDAALLLTQAVTSAQSHEAAGGLTALIVGIVLALWSASSGMAATQIGLDIAYDVPEDRTLLKRRLMSVVLIFAAFVLGGIGAACLVFGEPLTGFVRDHLPLGRYFGWVWGVARWAITLVAVTLLFAVFYSIGPNRKRPTWKWLSPGGLVATALWLIASLGFSFYVSGFGGTYAKTYGALAGVVVLILWLYLSALAILVGAELNRELERERALLAEQAEAPGSARSAESGSGPDR